MNYAVKQKRTIPQEILQAGDGMLSPYGISLTELLRQENGGSDKQEPEGKLMLTYRETARMLGLSKDTVRRYIRSGILKGKKMGPHRNGAFRIFRASILAFLQNSELNAESAHESA